MPSKSKRVPLLLKIMARLGDIDIKEEYIPKERGVHIYGDWTKDGAKATIRVNPVPHVVDTVIHELIHEMFPEYSERAVRSLTGKIMKALTEEETKTIYSEYKRKVNKR